MRRLLYLGNILMILSLTGCGWIQGLRREIADEEDLVEARRPTVDEDFYRRPENRNLPPPPLNVSDSRAAILSGTPVDLGGSRAKQLRTTTTTLMAEAQKNENSLWGEDGQNNYLFARNKLKNPGDLVTLVLEDRLRKDMVDSFRILLPEDLRDREIRVPGLTKDKPDDKNRAPATAGAAPAAGAAEPGVDDLMTAEVLERYANGNIRVRGIKRVPFKNQVRNVEVLGILKGTDVDEQDMVRSSRMLEHRVELYR